MADPRGCEYHEVEIVEGRTFKTRAFVLPERPGDAGRFAVSWDGVVYPVSSVGPAADLDADIRALADAMRRAEKTTRPARRVAARGQSDSSSPLARGLVRPGRTRGRPGSIRTQALHPAPARPGRPGRGPVRRGDDRDARDPGPRPYRLSYLLLDAGPGMGRHDVCEAGGRPHAGRRRDRPGLRPAAFGVQDGGGGQGLGVKIRA